MEKDVFNAIQILALEAVLDPNYEAEYRKACRWYSKTFSTPLPQVLEMSEEHVWQTFFEDHFQALKEAGDKGLERLEEIVQSLTVTEEQAVEEQENDEEWVRQMNEEAKKDWGEKPEEPNLNSDHKDIDLSGEFDPSDMEDPTEAE